MATNIEQSYQERILKVLIYIQNNLDGDLSLEKLSSIACFSAYHFHRIFTSHTGESLKSYIRRLRLDRATRHLAMTDNSISYIAEKAGYDTQQSFHRAFKEVFHLTPKGFRDNARAGKATRVFNPAEYQVDIKTVEPIEVAFFRHIGDYNHVLESWLKLITEIGIDYAMREEILKIGIPYDYHETTPTDKMRYDACVSLNTDIDVKPKGKLGLQTIPGGQYAVIAHHGDLKNIETTYQYLFTVWLPKSGYESADMPNFMLHRKMPFVTPNDELVTEIYLPVRKNRRLR